ncbi:MAG: UvrD-helicase domain-containing protein [Actinomycetota bacterium]|nr:UvrD-helicase domain-containing protein [Actinomycetota bacterium]
MPDRPTDHAGARRPVRNAVEREGAGGRSGHRTSAPSRGRPLDPARFLEGLNPAQREAVVHGDGPLLVVAGAGSGKTTVLTNRIGYLIAERGMDPERILAITFTNKAAREMKRRLASSLGPVADDMWVSTFHSACARMLRPYADRVGLPRSFTILQEDDCRRLLRDVTDDLGFDAKQLSVGGTKALISAAKNRLVGPRQLVVETDDARGSARARIYAEYQQRLRRGGSVDFDDLLFDTVTLLRDHPDVLAHYQERFDTVLVDEYQDTNRAQSALVELLVARHRNLCCVGDGDQSIYGFRAADVGNILHFAETFPGTRTIVLDRNYRSTGTILDAANAVIANNELRPEKNLWTDAGVGRQICVREADDDGDEAAWIADQTEGLLRRGARPGDIAVLCRAKAVARPIEAELVRRAIPCRTVGGTPFFERREVKDLLAYLRMVVNRDDELSFRRCVNVPKRAVGDASIKKVRSFARSYSLSLGLVLDRRHEIEDLPNLAREGLDAFVALLDAAMAAAATGGPAAALDVVLADGAYLRELVAGARDAEEVQYREESVEQFRSIASDHASIEDVVDLASLVTADDDDDDGSRVLLMTIHASKGLEFPHVFVPAMEEGVFPDRRCTEGAELEEERRLAYVAITRARRSLYLSHARQRRVLDQVRRPERSRFLDEIPTDLVDPMDQPMAASENGVDRFASLKAQLGL